MIRISLSLVAVLAALSLNSNAQDNAEAKPQSTPETVAAAKALFAAMDMKSMLDNMYAPAIDAQLGQLKQIGLSDNGLQKLKAEMIAFFKEAMPYSEMEPFLVESYAANFSKSELDDLTAFYKTPTGQKALKLTPSLMAEGMKYGQETVQKKMPELQARIMPIIQAEMGQK